MHSFIDNCLLSMNLILPVCWVVCCEWHQDPAFPELPGNIGSKDNLLLAQGELAVRKGQQAFWTERSTRTKLDSAMCGRVLNLL